MPAHCIVWIYVCVRVFVSVCVCVFVCVFVCVCVHASVAYRCDGWVVRVRSHAQARQQLGYNVRECAPGGVHKHVWQAALERLVRHHHGAEALAEHRKPRPSEGEIGCIDANMIHFL